MGEPIVLPGAEPGRLAAAVHAVMADDGRGARLRAGAAQSMADEPTDAEIARRFQTLLEVGYLVASADGFADAERVALATLLEGVTGAAIDHRTLDQHFRDLDAAVAMLGRRERLGRLAAELEHARDREDAIVFAALIAMTDGRLDPAELDVLVELGEHVAIPAEQVRRLVVDAARRVEERLP